MTENTDNTQAGGEDDPRRHKLNQIIELGYDPFGQRFDDRDWIGSIRDRQTEIKFVTAAGEKVDLPNEADVPADQFRNWIGEQGDGQMEGPKVRAAGRIMLHRDKGKLMFIDLQDWSGTIQLFVGKNQVGEKNWELIKCLDAWRFDRRRWPVAKNEDW